MTKIATATPSQSSSNERDDAFAGDAAALALVKQRTDLAPLCRELAKSLWLYPRARRSDTTRTLAHGGHPLAFATLDDAEIIGAQFCRVRELASSNDITLGELMREVDLLDVFDFANEPLRKKLRGHLDALADAANGKASVTTAPEQSSPAPKVAPHWYSLEDYQSFKVLGTRYWPKKKQLSVAAKALDESRLKRMLKVDVEELLLERFPPKTRAAKIPAKTETPASPPATPKVQPLTDKEEIDRLRLDYELRRQERSQTVTSEKLTEMRNRWVELDDRFTASAKAGAKEGEKESSANCEPAGENLFRKLFQKRRRGKGQDVWDDDPLFGLLFAFEGEYLIIRDNPPTTQNATVS